MFTEIASAVCWTLAAGAFRAAIRLDFATFTWRSLSLLALCLVWVVAAEWKNQYFTKLLQS